MTKKLLISLIIVGTIASLTWYAITSVKADDNFIVTHPLISRLADRFNLKEEDVQAVFDAVRDERQEEIRKIKEERLNQAVKDGVISENQKQALLKKWQEMQEKRERERQEMQNWYQEQGIDPIKLMPYLGFGWQRGVGRWGMGKMY